MRLHRCLCIQCFLCIVRAFAYLSISFSPTLLLLVNLVVAFLSVVVVLFNVKRYYIHTDIIGLYNPSVRIIDIVFYSTYVMCVNFIHKWRLYSLKSTPNERFFEKLFMVILFTLRVFTRNLLREKSPKKYF